MKDELIAEMLEDICPNSLTSKCSLCWAYYECEYKQIARALVEKGYRKQKTADTKIEDVFMFLKKELGKFINTQYLDYLQDKYTERGGG